MNERSDSPEIIPTKRRKLDIHDSAECKKPLCFYGASCYRRSPAHLQEFRHVRPRRKNSPTEGNLPPCKYGAKCRDRNLLHFALYFHPTSSIERGLSSVDESDSDASADTDVEEDSSSQEKGEDSLKTNDGEITDVSAKISVVEMEQNECEVVKKSNISETKNLRNDSIFKRGPSIMQCYSILTEEQRRDLIKRAFEVKQVLIKQLSDTEEVLKNRNEEVAALKMKLDQNALMVEGELEAMQGSEIVYFPLYPQRKYKEDSAAQIHFRLAESQLYRLLPAGSTHKVTKVEYVVQPNLINRFKQARTTLKEIRNKDASFPVLGFHGTKEKNIESICEAGFRVPGEHGFQHATDPGWYGKGVYFSEYPKYSMDYILDSSKLLLCQVLPGKVFKCKFIIRGDPLHQGYDSHMSPDEKEVIIFNSHHILPSYIVHYAEIQGDFHYERDE